MIELPPATLGGVHHVLALAAAGTHTGTDAQQKQEIAEDADSLVGVAWLDRWAGVPGLRSQAGTESGRRTCEVG